VSPFRCPLCQKILGSYSYLRPHIISHLAGNVCPACGRRFKTYHALLMHFISPLAKRDQDHALFFVFLARRRVPRELKRRVLEVLRV